MSLAWDLHAQVANLGGQLCVLKLFKSSRAYSALKDKESVTCVGPERSSAAADPTKVTFILQANPRDLPWAAVIRLGEGKLQSKHEHNLHGPRTLPSAPCRAVHSPAIVELLPEPRVARRPLCCADRSKLRACSPGRFQARRTKSPTVDIFLVNWQYSTRVLPLLGCSRHVACPASNFRTISAAASGVPSPNFVGSTPLRSLSMCCSITQHSANFVSTSANAKGRSFRALGCGICCPGSDFFGPQSSGAIVAAVHSFAVLCGTVA